MQLQKKIKELDTKITSSFHKNYNQHILKSSHFHALLFKINRKINPNLRPPL